MGNDNAKTSQERKINQKLDALKDALVATMRVAWLSADSTDLSDEIIAAKATLEKDWKKKEEVQHEIK